MTQEETVIILAKDEKSFVVSDSYLIPTSCQPPSFQNYLVNLEKDKKSLEQKLADAVEQNLVLQSEIDNLKNINLSSAERLANMEKYIKGLEVNRSAFIEQKNYELNMLKQEVVDSWKKDDLLKQKNIDINNMIQELDVMKQIIAVKNNKIIDIEADIANLKLTIETKTNTEYMLQRKYDDERNIVGGLLATIENMKTDHMMSKNKDEDDLYATIQQKNKEIYRLNAMINELKQQISKEKIIDDKQRQFDVINKIIIDKQRELDVITNKLTMTTQKTETIVNYLKSPPVGKLVNDKTFELKLNKDVKGHIDIKYYGYHKATREFDANNVIVTFPKPGEYTLSLYMNFPLVEGSDKAVFIEHYRLTIR